MIPRVRRVISPAKVYPGLYPVQTETSPGQQAIEFWSDASKSSGSFAVSTNCHRIVSLKAALGSGLPKKPIHTKGCINDSDLPYSLLASKGGPQDLMFPWSIIKLH
ncbi:hypothetical protein VNO77_17771 [Canavalia gladiata]|uniref:Uncharacterized protein n=1 Tax=Canavalia gladiata TaxID=3824 RepID=A0AAN9LPJ5_CANGL